MFKVCLLFVAVLWLGSQVVKALVGGLDVEDDELLYHVFLRKSEEFVCSGALISRKHVLSLAYCIVKLRTRNFNAHPLANVILGTHRVDDRNGQIIPVKDIKPKENCYTLQGVFSYMRTGLITLKYEVTPSNIDMVIIPRIDEILIGTSAVVCGAFQPPESVLPVFKQLHVQITDWENCQALLTNFSDWNLSICVHISPEFGHCHTSTGDPLVQGGMIIGVANGDCTNNDNNGRNCVFIRVFVFADSIRQDIKHYDPAAIRSHKQIIPFGQ